MIPLILQYAQSLGHAVFTQGAYNLNIIGIRKRNGTPDAFDDAMTVTYLDEDGQWHSHTWPITTEPGLYYLMSADKQLNPAGTAVLKEGQYRGFYKIGLHGSTKYEALVQRGGKVTVWRDNNHDAEVDYGLNPETGWLGINIHASSMSPYEGNKSSTKVGAWSAGCQVFKNEADFRSFMSLCKTQLKHHPTWTTFTYSLISSPEW